LQVGVVLADCWNGNQPPQDQPVDDQGISWRNPQTKFEKECVKLHDHEDDTEEQHLDEPQRPHERMPLILVPLCWGELAQ
jgi:hypothetical protein